LRVITASTFVDFGVEPFGHDLQSQITIGHNTDQFLSVSFSTTGIEPTFSLFINPAAFAAVSFGRQQTGFFVITSLHFFISILLSLSYLSLVSLITIPKSEAGKNPVFYVNVGIISRFFAPH
jgi:hypothetical protein